MVQHSIFHVTTDGRVLDDLKCSACDLCSHTKLQSNCMDAAGNLNGPTFFIVGHNTGVDDDGIGEPFTGPNGQLLRDLLAEASIPEHWCAFSNLIKCCSHGQKVTDKHWQQCSGWFKKDLYTIKPQAIIAMGASAFKWLTGYGGMQKFRRHGVPCIFAPEINVFPIMQPAAIFHADSWKKAELRQNLVEDLQWLRGKAKEGRLQELDDIQTDYKWARTFKEAMEILDELEGYDVSLGCDLETCKPDRTGSLVPRAPNMIHSIGFSARPGHARAFPLYAWGTATLHWWSDEELQIILERIGKLLLEKTFFGHNFLQFDQKWIHMEWGIEHVKIDWDTQIAHFIIHEEPPHDLEALAMEMTTMQAWKKGLDFHNTEKTMEYLLSDCDAVYRIRIEEEKVINQNPQWAWLMREVYIDLGHELKDMETLGVEYNQEASTDLEVFLSKRIKEEEGSMRALPEVKAFELERNTQVSVTSTKHVSDIMENFLKLPCLKGGRTGNGAYSTAAWVLEHYSSEPFVAHLKNSRGLWKLKSTYVEGMMDRVASDGAIHTQYPMHGTVTARLASRNPNLQNIPREDTAGKVLEDGKAIKKMYKARDGFCLIQADYSQAELRIVAMFSRDETMMAIYHAGGDIHTSTAARVYGIPEDTVTKAQRNEAKIVNFGIIFGMQLHTVIEKFQTNSMSAAEKAAPDGVLTVHQKDEINRDGERRARSFWKRHQETFPQVWSYQDYQVSLAKSAGFVEGIFGHRRRFKWLGTHEQNQAKNFGIQNAAGFLTLIALVRCAKMLRQLGIDARPILTVHDSIVFECRLEHMWECATVAKHVMENMEFPWITLPMKADLEAGLTWGTLKEINVEERTIAA